MLSPPDQPGYYRQLAGRAIVLLGVTYALTLGGTFNGMLSVPLRQVSLVILTAGAALWLFVRWRRPVRGRYLTVLDPALVLWGAALAVSSLSNLSGRVTIGLWYAGLYAGAWLVLSDLRRRGLPGRWITDGALLATIPLMLLAWMQVADWFPAWLTLRNQGIRIAFAPPRPPSTLGNPNAFGAVLAMVIPLGLVRARWSLRPLDRVLWGVWVVCALGTLYLTYSRGAWLAAGCAVLALGVLTFPRPDRLNPAAWWQDRSHRTWLIAGAGVCAALVLIGVLIGLSAGAFETPRRATGTRVALYEVAGRTFWDHPLTGTGLFTAGLSILRNRSIPPDQPHAHAHNLILNVAAELGLPGLLALGVTLVLITRRGWRIWRDMPEPPERARIAACGAALVAFGVHGVVDMPMMVPAVMLLMLGVLAAGIGRLPEQTEGFQGLERFWTVAYHVVPVTIWGMVLITGWWSTRVYADYMQGERLLADGDYRRGADMLRHVADGQPTTALYHAAYAYACGLAAYGGDSGLLPAGIDAYGQALDLEPSHAVWWANLAALYWQAGQREQAVDAAQQAVHYAPDSADMWLSLGVYYEEMGIADRAETAYQNALEVDTQNLWGHALFWSATPLRQAVLAAYPLEPRPYMQAHALWEAGQPEAALAVLDHSLDHDPTQPYPYIDMARLYLAAGQLERAQDYLDAARLLVHTDQGEAWMRYIEAGLAQAQGEYEQMQERLGAARKLILPDSTGRPVVYGQEIANFQFLHLATRGILLPQVPALGPDPGLADLLQ
ncbi:MAG: O-antigen ligase family protein [Anaerolineae bacterium]|nr:O-antigen ligase family protein [Anaerolineae bacterium]